MLSDFDVPFGRGNPQLMSQPTGGNPLNGAPPTLTVPPTRIRYWVLLLLALVSAGSYLTRICLSTAATTIQKEFSISSERMGEILGAFFLGYLFFQIPTGWLGARFGGRLTLAWLNVGVSLCSLWGAFVAGPAMLWVSRFGLGVAQAGLVPCGSRGVLDWFPPSQRGRASSAISSSMSLGAVIASTLTAALLPVMGWRGVFIAYSTFGVAWAAVFYGVFRNRPRQHPWVNPAEIELIEAGVGPAPGADGPPQADPGLGSAEPSRLTRNVDLALAMVASRSTWMICLQAVFRAFGAAFFLTWFPAYLEKGHGVKLQDTGWLASLPLAATVLGALVGGVVIDGIQRWTGNRWLSRSGVAVAGLLVSAACSYGATLMPSPRAMVLLLSVGAFCFGAGGPASWAATMDISGKHTQLLFGLANMWGNAGAMASPKVVGEMFDRIEAAHGDWNEVLYLFVWIYLAGAVCWALLDPNRSAVEPPGAARTA
jgi:MFS family permease